ncbi:MAG: hypothetical protein WKF43_16915, partial [Acidimicrobiales bacterium]
MSSTSPSTPTRPGRLAQWVLLAAPLVLLVLAGWSYRWTFDDGFIYLRVVRQIREGHGPVFNTGQRVEAFTSPLWVAYLVLADLVTPLRLERLAAVSGIGSSLVGAVAAMAGAARLARRVAPQRLLVPVGIVVFLALLPVWYFETSGLETGLVFAWLGLCLYVLADWATSGGRPMSAPGALVLGLGWLVRPELVVDSLVFVAVVALVQWRAVGWRRRLGFLVWALGLPAAYQLFRMGYYGSVVANTAVAKEGSQARFDAGWSYLLDFAVPYWLWIPITLLIFGVYLPMGLRFRQQRELRSVWVLAAFATAAVLNATAVVTFGGDYVHGRLLLPALFALCAPVAVVPAAARYVASVAVVGWALVCAIGLRPPEAKTRQVYRDGIIFTLPPGRGMITVAENGWGPDRPKRDRLSQPAIFVATTSFVPQYLRLDGPEPNDVRLPTVVTGGIGALSYGLGSDVTILDINGLADPLAGHLELVQRGQPGHEKILPAPWVAARMTTSSARLREGDFPIRPNASTPPAQGMPFATQVAWARAALRCPAIADLERSTEGRLTPRRFLSNIWRSFGRARRRVPSDPKEAYGRFCGPTRSGRPPGREAGAGDEPRGPALIPIARPAAHRSPPPIGAASQPSGR